MLLGDGAGGCGAGTSFAAGDKPESVAVGDFDGDSNPDLAVANRDSGDVSVLRGDGAGGFGPATGFPVGDAPASVAVADFDGDTDADLAVANALSDSISVLLGDGAGSFGAATNYTAQFTVPMRSRWASSTATRSRTWAVAGTFLDSILGAARR